LFSKVETSDFGYAILYSLNYSLGFIAIYLLGFTLATKQPAMTAAAIARSLEEGIKNHINSAEKYKVFAKLFARLFRSQFIAFVGNVLVAFPVAMFIIWFIDYMFAINIAQEKHQKLLTDLSPIDSLAIFHASIAGLFLFLSGIISGNVSNKSKFSKFYYRIQENPSLKNNFGRSGARKIALWFEKNWAGVVSNGWFGVFLGSTASVGLFLGLNLDIRHITFAAGNFAMGLYGAGFQVDFYTIFWAIVGIFFIGLCNFMVSFSLSLIIALRSRNISFSELKLLNKAVWRYFKRKPFRFFLPILDKNIKPN
jgi:site-specific recombinase